MSGLTDGLHSLDYVSEVVVALAHEVGCLVILHIEFVNVIITGNDNLSIVIAIDPMFTLLITKANVELLRQLVLDLKLFSERDWVHIGHVAMKQIDSLRFSCLKGLVHLLLNEACNLKV